MSTAPLSWVQTVKQSAIDTHKIPLSGYTPPFLWDELSAALGSLFELASCQVQAIATRTMPASDIAEPFGEAPFHLPVHITPLAGHCHLVMAQEEARALTALALTKSHSDKGFVSSSLQEGFCAYLFAQVAALINQEQYLPSLTLSLSKKTPLPEEDALCIDMEVDTPKRSFSMRLALPVTLHTTLKTHFAQKNPDALSSTLLQQTPLLPLISVGTAHLTADQLTNLREGDFLILEHCSWDPKTHKGTASLLLQEIPIFRLRLKEDHLKILNYAISEDLPPMDDAPLPPEQDPELPPSEEFSPEEEKEFEEIEQEADAEPSEEAPPAEDEGLISTSQIPVTLVVEAARMQMSLDELLNLSPGNTIELPVKPEQGVHLTVQGKRIAKAELVKMGEVLGVRILKLNN